MQAWVLHAEHSAPVPDGGAVTLLVVAPQDAPAPLTLLPPVVIQARTDVGPDDLFAFLRRHSAAVAAAAAAAAAARSELGALARHTERQLRCRSLAQGAAVSDQEFREGCLALLAERQALREVLEGCRVRVSDENVIVPGSDVIEIAWNFEV